MERSSGQPPPFGGRLVRAQRIIRSLIAEVRQWGDSSPLRLVGKIREDRLQFTIGLDVLNQPPLEQWAYMFGEVIHQLRAALENHLVAIAVESGIADVDSLRRIQFPITTSSKEWKDNSRRVRDLPPAVQAAIHQVQPFNRGPDVSDMKGDLLLMLRDLSNRDKHQARVITTMSHAQLKQAATIEFETEEGAIASVPPDVRINIPSFETGGILYEHNTRGRIAKVTGALDYTLFVSVDLPDGQPIEVATLLNAMGGYIELVLTVIDNARPAGTA